MSDDVTEEKLNQRQALKRIAWVTVLNDGDTFTGLDGCYIAPTTDKEVKALDDDTIAVDDLPHQFSLHRLLGLAIEAGIFDEWLDEHGAWLVSHVPPSPE